MYWKKILPMNCYSNLSLHHSLDAFNNFCKNFWYAENYANDHDSWITSTKELLSTLPSSHYHLLGYLAIYLSRYEARHGRSAGVCGVFAPVILPHVPPATTLLRDILAEALVLFPDWWVIFNDFLSTIIFKNTCENNVGICSRNTLTAEMSNMSICFTYFDR